MTTYKHSVTELFTLQAFATPENVAVFDSQAALTYQQLNERSNQLAHWLLQQGIKPKSFVALLVEPSTNFIICILAILKAGAVYLPLDTSAPANRLSEILEDAAPYLLITDNSSYNINSVRCPTYKLNDLQKITHNFSTENPDCTQVPEDPMYMLYTSGSTGTPKGVIVPHCAVVNLTKTVNYAKVQAGEVMAQFSNIAFDASIFEIWSVLLNGATLAIIPLEIRKDHTQLQTFSAQYAIKYLFLPTSYFHQLARLAPFVLDAIQTLIIGGEQANTHLIKQFINYRKEKDLPITFINGYGPTETTVFSCQYFLDEQNLSNTNIISIGQTISNIKSYILDANCNPVPNGAEGELYISGINLALGYHNNPQLNEERFITNPFDHQFPYQRLYKTGDLARQLPNGNIIYTGRVDDQVKVQGFRVHLTEIENHLIQHPDINLAIVIAEKDNTGCTRLIAYLMFEANAKNLTSTQIRAFLANRLPPYMLPIKYTKIDHLPLSAVGKADRKQLACMKGIDLSDTKITLPMNVIEKKLTNIWAQLLRNDRIDVNKNLFELGANSLLLIQACDEISREFQYKCPLNVMLTHPSIRKLSQKMSVVHENHVI